MELRNGSNSEVLTPFSWPESNILSAQMACGRGASRCRRPHARGDVLCTETGRSHPRPERHAGPAHEGNSRTMSMNADEKSDEGMVPMKQPNKEGSPSAEAVEGRTSPEGNGGKTAAARTLRRDTASNGLVAVRRAARQSKRGSFVIGRKTIKKRMRAKLKAIKVELR